MKRFALLLPLLFAACAGNDTHPVQTVPQVDLQRYSGIWYEAARFPNRFEDGSGLDCADVTAAYSPLPDGRLRVVNQCHNQAQGRRLITARGRAYAVDGSGNAKLRVSFFWPFFGDYWVVGLAPDYSWAVVGEPGRDYLWVLSRTPQMPAATYEAAVATAAAQGFDVARLKRTVHTAGR